MVKVNHLEHSVLTPEGGYSAKPGVSAAPRRGNSLQTNGSTPEEGCSAKLGCCNSLQKTRRQELPLSLFDTFHLGLPYNDFLARYATDGQKQRWQQVHDQVTLNQAQHNLLAAFAREMNILCLAAAWCGDCASQCPIFERFAA